jgi:hypothetical protein
VVYTVIIRAFFISLALFTAVGSAPGDNLLPTQPGTTWRYESVIEVGKGAHFPEGSTPSTDGKVHREADFFLVGPEKIGATPVVKIETHSGGEVINIEWYEVGDAGLICCARQPQGAPERINLTPPQKITPRAIPAGESWNYDGTAGDVPVHQKYTVLGQEDVQVPAGKFRALHIETKDSSDDSISILIDRWFVPGTGFVKDVSAITLASGDLLERISLELKEAPKIMERPATKTPVPPKKLSAALAKELTGEVTAEFSTDWPKIFARWQGNGLPEGAKIRVVWIAEDVGADIAPPNHKLDEVTITADKPDDFGTFTLSRPDKGWPIGRYRAEFYVGDELTDTVKFSIVK